MSETEIRPSNNAIGSKPRNPYTVWFVVLSFVAPVALAYIVFYFVDVTSFVNRGEILQPIVNISSFKLKDENNKLIPKEKLTYKWRLISFVGKDCNKKCESRLYDTRQIHSALGKDRHRVMRMFIHTAPASASLTELIETQHPDVIHVYGDSDVVKTALGKNIRKDAGIDDDETYIMDPMGNVMMRFTPDQPSKDFLHDLKKLLKVSQIG